jgi:hypothetical protein
MGTTVEHPLAKAYVEQLDQSLSLMGPSEAAVLRAQIIDHLNLSLSSTMDDSEVDAVLDELGRPDAIVAEALRDPRVMRQTSWFVTGLKIIVLIVTALVLVASLALLVSPLFGGLVPPLTMVIAALLFIASLWVLNRLRTKRARP